MANVELIEELNSHLRSGSVDSRYQAMEQISQMESGSVPLLAIALRDDEEEIREWAATLLSESDEDLSLAVDALVEACGDSNESVARLAVEALGKLPTSPTAVSALGKALSRESTREVAAEILEETGAASAIVLKDLTNAFWQRDTSVRPVIAATLDSIGGQALIPLVQATEFSVPEVRGLATYILRNREQEIAAQMGKLIIQSDDPVVRREASYLLGLCQEFGRKHLDALIQAKENDADLRVVAQAESTIEKLGGHDGDPKQAQPRAVESRKPIPSTPHRKSKCGEHPVKVGEKPLEQTKMQPSNPSISQGPAKSEVDAPASRPPTSPAAPVNDGPTGSPPPRAPRPRPSNIPASNRASSDASSTSSRDERFWNRTSALDPIADSTGSVTYRIDDSPWNHPVKVRRISKSIVASSWIEQWKSTMEMPTHPNVARVLGVEEEDKEWVIISEWILGENLRRWLKKTPSSSQTLKPAVDIFEQIGEALSHVHRSNQIHGLVSPENLIVTEDDDAPRITLTDIGHSSRNLEQAKNEQISRDVLPFVAPEVLLGKRTGSFTDVYGMTAILYYLLTESPPFGASTPTELARRICHDPPPNLSERKPKWGGKIAGLIDSGLAKVSVLRCLDPSLAAQHARDLIAEMREGRTPAPSSKPNPDPGADPNASVVERKRPPTTQWEYDAFFSFAGEDAERVLKFENQLRSKCNLRCYCYTRDESTGAIPRTLSEALAHSRKLVLFCSLDALRTNWIRNELEQYVGARQLGTQHIIPVRLHKNFTASDLDELYPGIRHERFVDSFESALELATIRKLAEAIMPPSNAPRGCTRLFGRAAGLKQVEKALETTGRVGITGISGIGKTELAIAYAREFEGSYANGVFWLNAGSQETLRKSCLEVAPRLRIYPGETSHNLVWEVLNAITSRYRTLLVLDGLDDPSEIAVVLNPDSVCHILVTSLQNNLESLGIQRSLRLEGLPAGTGADFLMQRAELDQPSVEERKAAEQLVDKLGGLPVALEQAAVVVKHESSFASCVASFETQDVLHLLGSDSHSQSPSRKSLLKGWSVNRDRLTPAADMLFRCICLFHHQEIPERLILRTANQLKDRFPDDFSDVMRDPMQLRDVLRIITGISFLRRVDSERYTIHPLLQRIERDAILKPDHRAETIACLDACVLALEQEFRIGGPQNSVFVERLAPHVKSIQEQIGRLGHSSLAVADLQVSYARYLLDRGDSEFYDDVEEMLDGVERVLETVGADSQSRRALTQTRCGLAIVRDHRDDACRLMASLRKMHRDDLNDRLHAYKASAEGDSSEAVDPDEENPDVIDATIDQIVSIDDREHGVDNDFARLMLNTDIHYAVELSKLHVMSGEFRKAKAECEETEELINRLLALRLEPPARFELLVQKAESLQFMFCINEAAEVWRHAYEFHLTHALDEDLVYAELLSNMAGHTEDAAKSEDYLLQSIALKQRYASEDRSCLVDDYLRFAFLQQSEDDRYAATQIIQQVRKMFGNTFDRNHSLSRTIDALEATLQVEAGQMYDAICHVKRELDRRIESIPNQDRFIYSQQLLMIAESMRKRGEFNYAQQACARCVRALQSIQAENEPPMGQTYVVLAHIMANKRSYKQAEKYLGKAIEIFSDHRGAKRLLARAQFLEKNLKEQRGEASQRRADWHKFGV